MLTRPDEFHRLPRPLEVRRYTPRSIGRLNHIECLLVPVCRLPSPVVLKTSGILGTTEWSISSNSIPKLTSQMRLIFQAARESKTQAHLLPMVRSSLG